MKNLYVLLFTLVFTIFGYSQVPQGISYQAVAFNASGIPVSDGTVGVRVSILDNSVTGSVVYTETHTKTTNAQGLFNLNIGQGAPTVGTFSSIQWGVNTKFLKVEVDPTGGTSYTLVGTNQLLAVPYALAAGSLITSPGEGITLVSPNGTPYQLTVDNNGQLSLPTSNSTVNAPTELYLYGSFNSYDAVNALQFGNFFQYFIGYKYFTAGTQIKFLAAQNENVVYGGNGNNMNGTLVLNGTPVTIQSNGFYRISVDNNSSYEVRSINVELETNFSQHETMSYNTGANKFFINSATYGEIRFVVDRNNLEITYGDNLADGVIEIDGAFIDVPFISGNPSRLFELNLNFNGTGTYTIN